MAGPADAFARAVSQALAASAAQTLKMAFAKAVTGSALSMSTTLSGLGRALEADDADARRSMFQRIGENAQRSMVASYGQLVTRQEGPASRTHYRAGSGGRLAGGILQRALASPQFFEATSQGLNFGNVEFLDGAAAHWHRVNFGAGARGQGDAREFPVSFGSAVGTAIGFNEGPSPAFVMPPGVFVNPESGGRVPPGIRGGDEFYPQISRSSTLNGRGILGRPNKLKATAGIEAKNFMDAGLRRIAQDLPDAIDDLVKEKYDGWYNAAKNGKAPTADTLVQFKSPDILKSIQVP